MDQVGKWHTTGVSFLDTDKDDKWVFLAALGTEDGSTNRRSAQAIQQGQVYDFRQIAAKMTSVHPRETDALGGGGGGSPDAVLTIVLICGAVFLAGVGGVLWKYRRAR